MPKICIRQSGEAPERLGKLYLTREECEKVVKGRDESKPYGASSITCNSVIKQLIGQYRNGGEDKAWGYHTQAMNTAEVERIKNKKKE